MSESYDYNDDQLNEISDENDFDTEQEPGFVKKLRHEAKEAKQAKARLSELEGQMASARKDQQELAMRRAGIDPESPLAAMFAKANPTLVDVDTLKSEWDKLTDQVNPPVAEDVQALQRINQAQAGSSPSGGAAPVFEDELDAIPMLIDNEWNPEYVSQVLNATQVQSARENKEFVVDRPGTMKWATSGAVTRPLS